MESQIVQDRIETPQGVKAWEAPFVIPTYQIGAEDPNPSFHRTGYWSIYPYTMQDDLTGVKKDRTYRAVFLENDYLRLIILPELGGHLYSALDKTNGQEMFYRTHVIKPGLVALRGAWIAGGIEFNFPKGHSTTTVSPIDHAIVAHRDGSVTVAVGDLEKIHRMQWLVGITLYPDRAYIETDIRLYNRTAVPNRFYYWSNAAVRATPSTQFPYPMTSAYAGTIIPFPIHNGRDLSWYVNHPKAVDLFARDTPQDYFCSYDHDTQAGVAHVADHHESPGKKFFTWGASGDGLLWAGVLSDGDGPYCEIQSGRFQDQSTWEMIQPHALESWKEYWWPLKAIGNFVYANEKAALGLDFPVQDDKGRCSRIAVAVNTTCALPNARLVLAVAGDVMYSRAVDLSPRQPFSDTVLGLVDVKDKPVTLALTTDRGEEIASYTRPAQAAQLKPEPLSKTWPKTKAEHQMTAQELYYVGFQKEKADDEAAARALYHKALALDPGYVEAHAALGMLALKRGDWAGAESAFRTALTRDTEHPASAYGLGQTLRAQGNYAEAKEILGGLVRSQTYGSPAFYLLGEMTLQEKRLDRAASYFERGLSLQPRDVKAIDMLAVVLRKQGRIQDASALLDGAQELLPTDFLSHAERYFLDIDRGEDPAPAKQALTRMLRGDPQSYLELAVDYGNVGLFDEAIEVLSQFNTASEKSHPMVLYYLGYYHERRGEEPKALEYYRLAGAADHDYVFPHRLESLAVLHRVLALCPQDANAHYYLGNLLYAKEYFEEARASWKRSAGLQPDFSVVHRNLGLAYWRLDKDLPAAVEAYERAVACNPHDYRLYLDLNTLYEATQQHDRRLSLLERAPKSVQDRGDVAWRMATLHVQRGAYDVAIELLKGRTFNQWEGAVALRQVYLDAYLGRGKAAYDAGSYEAALGDFVAALDYPPNLGIGKPSKPKDAKALYLAGLACQALGRSSQAKGYWGQAASEEHEKGSELRYYEALSLGMLNEHEKAQALFDELVAHGRAQLRAGERPGEAHYLMGLGYKGKGERTRALKAFSEALRADPSSTAARRERSEMLGRAA